MNKPSTYIPLPTDKSTVESSLSNIILVDGELKLTPARGNDSRGQHLYILSDERCNKGEYKYCSFTGKITQYNNDIEVPGAGWCEHCRKIIATTNPALHSKVNLKTEGDAYIPDVPKISQSDIQYIISLYNVSKCGIWHTKEGTPMCNTIPCCGKFNADGVEKLALDSLKNNWEHLYINGSYPSKPYPTLFQKEVDGWCNGYNKCLQYNIDNKFTLGDMNAAMNHMFYYMRNPDKRSIMDVKNDFLKTLDKLKSKIAIMVEYDEINMPSQGHGTVSHVKYKSKLKDGHIIIIR